MVLSSEDGFKREWTPDAKGILRAPALYNGAFSTIAFLIGGVTSILSGFLGMKIATYANARTALEARKGIAPAFMVGKSRSHRARSQTACFDSNGQTDQHRSMHCAAFRSGAVMGFLLAGNALLVLYFVILAFKRVYGDDWEGHELYENMQVFMDTARSYYRQPISDETPLLVVADGAVAE